MMIDAAGKPYAFQISLESLEFFCIVRNRQVTINNLQYLSDTEIIFSKLIKRDVSPPQGGFRQVEYQRFLPNGQL